MSSVSQVHKQLLKDFSPEVVFIKQEIGITTDLATKSDPDKFQGVGNMMFRIVADVAEADDYSDSETVNDVVGCTKEESDMAPSEFCEAIVVESENIMGKKYDDFSALNEDAEPLNLVRVARKSPMRSAIDPKGSIHRTASTDDRSGRKSSTHRKKEPLKSRIVAKHTCVNCSKTFTSKHLRRHTCPQKKEDSFSCFFCNKSFSRKFYLKVHTRRHTGEGPYNCETCNKSFSSKFYLKVHTRHHTGEKPYTCSTCDKTFICKSYLQWHARSHSAEKPSVCLLCNSTFSCQSSLVRHRRIHTGERPYTCSICQKSFNRSGHLKRHLTIHAAEKL